MILCSVGDLWFLSSGIDRAGRCSLSCGAKMQPLSGFLPLPPIGAQLYGKLEDLSQVRFFPALSFHGLPVTPLAWSPDHEEPILRCDASPDEWPCSEYFDDLRARTAPASLWKALTLDGWERPDPYVFERYLHVDDLELVEGDVSDGRH